MAKNKFQARPFPYHHELELVISTLTNRGVGLGRVPLNEPKAESLKLIATTQPETGWVVMVPFTLPGERVRVRIFRNHKNFSEADLVEVLQPSPHRVSPRCPLFGHCGGCQYQHLTYAEQLVWKRQQVEELLQHMAGVSFPVAPVIGSPMEFGYRSKITPHFNPPRADGTMPIGFLRQGTRFDLVDVPHCDIATDAINAQLTIARAAVLAQRGSYQRGSTLLLRDAGGAVATEFDTVITETVGRLKLRFLARDFFQNNPFILPAFTAYVSAQACASGARFLVDTYCGSGLFALSAAEKFERVAGVEISMSSIVFAQENATTNGIGNATFLASDAAAIFGDLDFPAGETAVIIDPPRKGCDAAFVQQLIAYGPRTVVYVSCDPATQMRDLAGFLAAGYHLTAVQPFDLFPQTRHLECVITLTGPTS
ncbi:MAG: class I SAM-dependent RNA methyltransferase [Cephaloticoccus sp.]|nr:class I SAM-dependent RNA methyltransferase [Cephaloticoccus sp.]MCF7761347.1 class I SAM-dependent RNA methyltransferase [Cephaloticoccus sp.]